MLNPAVVEKFLPYLDESPEKKFAMASTRIDF